MSTPTPAVFRTGPSIDRASRALILIHGRGAGAAGILPLGESLGVPGVVLLAPEAPTRSWWPQSFLAPIEANQPSIDIGLASLDSVVTTLDQHGIAPVHVMLMGFSQGACLVSEYVARNPRRYGGVAILTGGVIGPKGTPRNYSGDFEGTPVFMGTSDPDPHVPLWRVEETRDELRKLGAQVELSVYPDMPHTVNEEEIDRARTMLTSMPAVAGRR